MEFGPWEKYPIQKCLNSFDALRVLHVIMSYRDRITINPKQRGGKPCIRGLRITVYDILEYLASGMTRDEILSDFPYLEQDDITASLMYAADREKHMLVHAA